MRLRLTGYLAYQCTYTGQLIHKRMWRNGTFFQANYLRTTRKILELLKQLLRRERYFRSTVLLSHLGSSVKCSRRQLYINTIFSASAELRWRWGWRSMAVVEGAAGLGRCRAVWRAVVGGEEGEGCGRAALGG